MTRCLAIDIGAESGRSIVGELDSGILKITETNRFPNKPLHIAETLRWDIDALLANVIQSAEMAALSGGGVSSVGIDTWAIDFVLVDFDGQVLDLPYQYRDARTDGMMAEVFGLVGQRELYQETGIQFLPFNTIFQLHSMVRVWSPLLDQAFRFLTIPDFLNLRVAGRSTLDAVCEYTNATTTQLISVTSSNWDWNLLKRLGLPRSIFPPIVRPGTELGSLRSGARLIAPACHDTGSAVAAVPMEGEDCAWISSGTWSVMGFEATAPVVNDDSFRLNITNEGGVYGTYRVSKNVMGLWILQQCREVWNAAGNAYSYERLAEMAEGAKGAARLFDPDQPDFLKPGDMPARVVSVTGLAPENHALIARSVLESLAHKYKVVLGYLEQLVGRKLSRIYIIGGGSQNRLLNQLTANYCGVPVIAGPVEATAIGNLLVQMISLGEVSDLAEGRRIVGRSFDLDMFEPK